MSNSLAIATVTAALQRLLNRQVPEGLPADLPAEYNLGEVRVTTRAPDKARTGTPNQLNLFLYQTSLNPAWRNHDMPDRVKPGEAAFPPLALDLYYLLTAYGRENNDINAHILLGQAMRVLHDNSVLSAVELRRALPGSDLHDQIDRVRIRVQPLSIEEMSKLWSTFQTNYQLSVAYEVAVVLIESARPARAALPVLTRGQGDRGPQAAPDLELPYPVLTEAGPESADPSLTMGGRLILRGQNLEPEAGTPVRLRFTHAHLGESFEREAEAGGSADELRFTVPAGEGESWKAGLYRVAAIVKKAGEAQPRTTNEVMFGLAPAFSGVTVARTGRLVNIQLEVQPRVNETQRVALLLGDRELPPRELNGSQIQRLRFSVQDLEAGQYFIRLRIDGVDSLLIDRSVSPPVFKSAHRITVPS